MGVISDDNLQPAAGEIEVEMREYLRKEPLQTSADMVRRVAGTLVTDIDNVLTQLTQLRDHLQKEAQRVQREIDAYAQISHVAVQSSKVIAQSMGQFKRAAGKSQTH
jgi:hypothetical protein